MVLLLEQERGYPEEFEFDYASRPAGPRPGNEGAVAGELDSVVCATLDMQRIAEWAQEDGRDFGPLIDILEGGQALEDLFDDRSELKRPPGRKSALTAEQVQQLREAGVIERKAYADGEIRNVVTARTIPKPSGLLRLIVNGRSVGLAQTEPPHVDLPSLEDVREAVRNHRFMIQMDGKSWFYQFPARGIRRYFALRTEDGWHWMVVLPMGWSYSVWIAQEVSSLISRRALNAAPPNSAGLTYIDNWGLFAQSAEEARQLADALKKTCEECGAVIKEEDHSPAEQADFLGMKLDFEHKTIALTDRWVSSFSAAASRYLLCPSKWSVRSTWKLLGGIMWATRVLGFKHFHMPNLKAWMSRTAKAVMEGKLSWESRTKWWQLALSDFKLVVSFIVTNTPSSVLKPEASSNEQLWLDACPSGGGYLLEERELSSAWPWETYWAADQIHVLEAEALRRALKRWLQVRGENEGVKIMNDNQLVVHALTQGKARGYRFNMVLRDIDSMLSDVPWDVTWVPSAEQKADLLSRAFETS